MYGKRYAVISFLTSTLYYRLGNELLKSCEYSLKNFLPDFFEISKHSFCIFRRTMV